MLRRTDIAKSAGRALEDIRDRMVTCTRIVPEGIHPESIAVSFPDGSRTVAARVADTSTCSGDPASYLDPDH